MTRPRKQDIASQIAMLRRFQRHIVSGEDKDEINYYFVKRNSKILIPFCLMILCVDLFWFIVHLINPSTDPQLEAFWYSGLGIQIGAAISMLLLFFFNHNFRSKIYKAAFPLFFVLIEIGIASILISQNLELASVFGADVSSYRNFFGTSLVTFFLIAVIVMPCPDLCGSIAVLVGLVASVIVPLLPFVPGSQAANPYYAFVISVSFIAIYIFFYLYEQKNAKGHAALESVSYVDHLTGALNRRSLDTYWEFMTEINPDIVMGSLILDIDDFKSYNDYYFHVQGDKILKDVVRIICSSIDLDRDLLFRYGGEEFIVLIPDCDKETLLKAADEIHNAVINAGIYRADIKTREILTVSIGAALVKATDDYVSLADSQLFIGKNSNKNCVVYEGEVVIWD